METDCLIIGYNDSNFEEYVNMVRSMGMDSGAYRDLNLAFITHDNKPYRALDILNHFDDRNGEENYRPLSNMDFLSPAILYLSTYLVRKGFSFDYINLFDLEKEQLKEKLQNDNILTIAITTTLYVSPYPLLEIMSFIKKHNSTAKIIIGGPYVANQVKMLNEQALQQIFKYIGADIYVISDEGEWTLTNVLKALKDRLPMNTVENIAYRKGEDYVRTPISKEANSLEENMVDYRLFQKKKQSSDHGINEFVSIRTAKSCPFSCSFCGYPIRVGQYRYLNTDLVEKELDAIKEIGGITTLSVIDDTFNVPPKRFKEILRMMIKNQYNFKWNSYYRSDQGDEETIELMRESGCEGVFLGIESGSDRILKNMKKTARRKDYMQAIPLFKKNGITTHTNLLVGFPGETYETVQETVSLIEEAQPDFFRAQLWYCDPITPIWQQREEFGIQGEAFTWSHNTMDYQMACDLIEEMFFPIESSVWLPQYGFELWSVFYLQRKGMTMEQIKRFVKCFNAIIHEKLLFPNKKETTPHLIEDLKQSCFFDASLNPQKDHIQPATMEELALLESI